MSRAVHDISWFVNFSGNFLGSAKNHGDPDYKADKYPQRTGLSAISSNSSWQLRHPLDGHSSHGVKRLIPLPCQPEPEEPGQQRTAENADEINRVSLACRNLESCKFLEFI